MGLRVWWSGGLGCRAFRVHGFRAQSNPKKLETGLRTISAGISYACLSFLLKIDATGVENLAAPSCVTPLRNEPESRGSHSGLSPADQKASQCLGACSWASSKGVDNGVEGLGFFQGSEFRISG